MLKFLHNTEDKYLNIHGSVGRKCRCALHTGVRQTRYDTAQRAHGPGGGRGRGRCGREPWAAPSFRVQARGGFSARPVGGAKPRVWGRDARSHAAAGPWDHVSGPEFSTCPPPPPVPSPLAGALPPARGRQNQSFEKRRPSLGAASPRGSGPLGTLPSQGSRLQAQDTLGTPPSSEQSHLGGEVALAGAVWGQRASKGPVVAAGPVLGAWWAEWPPRPRAQGRADRGTAGASRRQSWACPGPAAPEQVVRLGPHPPPHPMLRAPHRPRHSTPPRPS